MPRVKKPAAVEPQAPEVPVKAGTVDPSVSTEHIKAPVAAALPNVEVEDNSTEVLETRNGFSLFRNGKGYSVQNRSGVVIAPLTSKEEAEQLFRNMYRKF